jgi:hypothetical protein
VEQQMTHSSTRRRSTMDGSTWREKRIMRTPYFSRNSIEMM